MDNLESSMEGMKTEEEKEEQEATKEGGESMEEDGKEEDKEKGKGKEGEEERNPIKRLFRGKLVNFIQCVNVIFSFLPFFLSSSIDENLNSFSLLL